MSAGASSRLLIDYPDQQRQEILNYLFKPAFGAALNILKVEIGGDTNSTDGSEPSHEPVRGQEDYKRGYEWWLMEQAKALSPDIKLWGLSWGVPGWIGNGNYWSQDNIDYQIAWIQHAKSDHGLTIDYVGGWNEKGYDATWYVSYKAALNKAGFTGKLVGFDDNHWNNFGAIQNNTALSNAVDIWGVHYSCQGSNGDSCSVPAAAIQSGKTLWDSEEGSADYDGGAARMAKVINRMYIDGKLASFVNWSLIWSVYPTLPYFGSGLMLANSPWSGNYTVGKSIWACAHTSQFALPGWKYLDSASGYLRGDRGVGSFVAIKSATGNDYSLVVETVNAKTAVPITISVTGGLAGGALHVWRTDLNSNKDADHFVRQPDLPATGCTYSVSLSPGCLYTFTTTTGQGRGTTTPPAAAPLSLPYSDNFDSYTPSAEARYFSDMNGAFVVAPCAGGRTGRCLAQTAPAAPIAWNGWSGVVSLVGDTTWTDYQVQVETLLQQAGSAQVMGRMSNTSAQNAAPGYLFEASNDGTWRLFVLHDDKSTQTLATGKASFALGAWHTLKIGFQGSTISGWIDGTMVASVHDTTYSKGNAGIGVGGWTLAQFDNFSVSGLGGNGAM